jgi:hypothetical protein
MVFGGSNRPFCRERTMVFGGSVLKGKRDRRKVGGEIRGGLIVEEEMSERGESEWRRKERQTGSRRRRKRRCDF